MYLHHTYSNFAILSYFVIYPFRYLLSIFAGIYRDDNPSVFDNARDLRNLFSDICLFINQINRMKVWYRFNLSFPLLDLFTIKILVLLSSNLDRVGSMCDRFGSGKEELKLNEGGARETIDSKVNWRESQLREVGQNKILSRLIKVCQFFNEQDPI